jgi:hypothetical protein
MTRPGEIVENFGKNWRIAMARKKTEWEDRVSRQVQTRG